MTNAQVIEAMLLRWGENHSSGRTVTFQLPEDTPDHPFKGLPCGPTNGQRVALSVALIGDDEKQQPAPKREFRDMPRSAQAAMLCNEPRFQTFLDERYAVSDHSESYAGMVRSLCNVESRADLDKFADTAARWDRLYSEYQVWLKL